jgi:hypothetical protein
VRSQPQCRGKQKRNLHAEAGQIGVEDKPSLAKVEASRIYALHNSPGPRLRGRRLNEPGDRSRSPPYPSHLHTRRQCRHRPLFPAPVGDP